MLKSKLLTIALISTCIIDLSSGVFVPTQANAATPTMNVTEESLVKNEFINSYNDYYHAELERNSIRYTNDKTQILASYEYNVAKLEIELENQKKVYNDLKTKLSKIKKSDTKAYTNALEASLKQADNINSFTTKMENSIQGYQEVRDRDLNKAEEIYKSKLDSLLLNVKRNDQSLVNIAFDASNTTGIEEITTLNNLVNKLHSFNESTKYPTQSSAIVEKKDALMNVATYKKKNQENLTKLNSIKYNKSLKVVDAEYQAISKAFKSETDKIEGNYRKENSDLTGNKDKETEKINTMKNSINIQSKNTTK